MIMITGRGALCRIVVATMILWPALAQARVDKGRAQAPSEEMNRPATVYLSVSGGWALMHISDFNSTLGLFFDGVEPAAEASIASSRTVGGAVGYRGKHRWRYEFEVTRHTNQFESIQWNEFTKYGGYVTTGEIETTAYMVNFLGDFDPMGKFQVFMGVGLGIADFKLDNVSDSDGPLFSTTDRSLAGQFLFGVKYALIGGLAVSAHYKYFGSVISTRAHAGQPEIGGHGFRLPIGTSSFNLGLSYYF